MAQLGFNQPCHTNLSPVFLYQGFKSYKGGISPAGITPLNRAEFSTGQKKTADLKIMVHAGKTPASCPAPQLHVPSSQHHKRKHNQRLAMKVLL